MRRKHLLQNRPDVCLPAAVTFSYLIITSLSSEIGVLGVLGEVTILVPILAITTTMTRSYRRRVTLSTLPSII